MKRTPLKLNGFLMPGGRVTVEYTRPEDENRARSLLSGRARSRGLHLKTRKLAEGMIVGEEITRAPGDGTFQVVHDNGTDYVVVKYTAGDVLADRRARTKYRHRLHQRLGGRSYVLTQQLSKTTLQISGHQV